MARKMIVMQADGASPVLTEMPAVNEKQLQDLIKNNPDLLPVDEFGMTGPLMVVGRETTLRSGAVDLVCLARSGELLIIEFKTGPQNSDFRHALAQLLDYGADLWKMTVDEFESTVAVRYFTGSECQDLRLKGKPTFNAGINAVWPDMTPEQATGLRETLAQGLQTGTLHFVLAAQRFTPTMEQTIEYLNETRGAAHFYAVEVVRFGAGGVDAFEARTVVMPAATKSGGSSTPAELTDEMRFLEAVPDDAYRSALREILEVCRGLKLRSAWGTKGASLRVPTPDRAEPLTVAWVFHQEETSGWMGLRGFTLGYDPGSAKNTPSVAPALEQYINAVSALTGATAVTKAGLRAFQVPPATVVKDRGRIAEILAALVQQDAGDEGESAPALESPSDGGHLS